MEQSGGRCSWVEQIMGMPISVLARGPGASSAPADAAVQAVFAELRHVDATFSPFRPDSALSRYRRGELTARATLNEVAERCAAASILTCGLFDATRPDGTWDPSGYVKGWAVERAGRHLAVVADIDWCVNAGGDVLVLSEHTFNVGIQDPHDVGRVATVLTCGAGGVATSGTAARGSHLYDPRRGGACESPWASVTVIGPSLEMADVLATAAFVAGPDWERVVALAAYRGLAIDQDGGLHRTGPWPAS